MPFTASYPLPTLFPPCRVVSLAEAQARSDIRYRPLRHIQPSRKPLTSIYTEPKPVLDFESHKLETTLIPRSMAALFDEIRYRGL
ncbi:hypothetical protein EIP91_009689 [Steccherinum ochraceum]|uniref:Uncharacterized protein n=1 Tax=Steccherinum ochraceum TaxID=92696 RepID=A0A4R0RNU0_9APHY|nr:hypothetical protein EIP91_009689 [Steccherinum ochraceum]